MLAFFRINDPYRVIGIFLLIIAIRIPLFFGSVPLTNPELEWMVVGESISFDRILYLDLWDDSAPLSALVYSIIDSLFGRSQTAYLVISMLLVFAQSVIFNQLAIFNKVFKENTYVPAMIYGVVMALFFDFFTLSPVLMSMLFIMLLVKGIFNHIAHKGKDEHFLNMGWSLGVAILFYLPSIIFLSVALLTLTLYSNMTLKKYLLLIFGAVFPLVLVSIYFFWHGALVEFYEQYFLSWVSTSAKPYVPATTLLYIALPTGVLLIFSLIVINSATRFSNQQTNFLLVMMWFFLAGISAVLLVKDRAPHQLIILAIPVSFYLSHFFLLIRRRFLAELIFLSFFSAIMIINYGNLKGIMLPDNWFNFDRLLVRNTPWDDLVAGKKILILGKDLNAYKNSTLATPYFNWDLTRRHLGQLQSYNNLSVVFREFSAEMPEVLIDQQGVVLEMFEFMPTLGDRYVKSDVDSAYILKP